MKLFECQHCGQLLYFENTRCERCGHVLGYLPDRENLATITGDGCGRWHALGDAEAAFGFCSNTAYDVCSWLVPADAPETHCRACQLNRTTPNLDEPENLLLWRRLEAAKHRLVFGLLRHSLPLVNKFDDAEKGLAFDFLAGSGATFWEGPQIITGHRQGLITKDISEADNAERERHRRDLAEPYRTLLGHFRHESGHYYWERLVRGWCLARSLSVGAWRRAIRLRIRPASPLCKRGQARLAGSVR